jgi:hypothetical protein
MVSRDLDTIFGKSLHATLEVYHADSHQQCITDLADIGAGYDKPVNWAIHHDRSARLPVD